MSNRPPKGVSQEAWEQIKASTKVRVGSKQEENDDTPTPVKPSAKLRFLSWDWKESPGEVIEELTPVLKKLGVILEVHDTGSDSYVCSVGTRAATEEELEDYLENGS
jgi:hypothetical protein